MGQAMTDDGRQPQVTPSPAAESGLAARALHAKPVGVFCAYALVLCACFWRPLLDWVRFAVGSDLYSYVVLVPGIVLYLVWLQRKSIPASAERSWGFAAALAIAGLAALAGYWRLQSARVALDENDSLALSMSALICLL
jgi:hypothetical protein